MTVLAMAAVGLFTHTYSPRLLGIFWIVWLPTAILSGVANLRRLVPVCRRRLSRTSPGAAGLR
jgi:hypothetical protein